MFRAVVFDMDGVIFDSETLVFRMWKIVAEKYGVADIEETCRACLGINATVTKEIFLERYGQDFPYDKYKKEMSDLFHANAAGGKLPKKPADNAARQTAAEKKHASYLKSRCFPVVGHGSPFCLRFQPIRNARAARHSCGRKFRSVRRKPFHRIFLFCFLPADACRRILLLSADASGNCPHRGRR